MLHECEVNDAAAWPGGIAPKMNQAGRCIFCDDPTRLFKNGRHALRCAAHADSGGLTRKPKTPEQRRKHDADYCHRHHDRIAARVRLYRRRPDVRTKHAARSRLRRQKVAAAAGRKLLPPNGAGVGRRPISEKTWDRFSLLNARQAWQFWLRCKAPEWWLAAYWATTGKPWNRPGLSPGKKWRTRYEFDAVFRKIEYQRLQRVKRERRNWITSSVGALNAKQVRTLREEATHCAECSVKFTAFRETTVDHIMALARGGQHINGNVRIVCLPCNSRLGARPRETELAGPQRAGNDTARAMSAVFHGFARPRASTT